MSASRQKTTRHTIDLSEDLEAELRQIAQECNSVSDVFRDGINTLHYLLYEIPEGSTICYRKPGGATVDLVIMYSGGVLKPKGQTPPRQ